MPCGDDEALTERGAAADAVSLITDDDVLAARIAALGSTVGLDTEFVRVNTFFPIPALYQLAGNDDVALVDGQAPATFASLKALLLDPARTKIVHACSEDLEVMARHLDLRPVNAVDTQLAHAFLTPEFSVGYAKLVEHYLGLNLPKHETRSDWLRRPLSPEQINYAREDAAYLVPIWEQQHEALASIGRRPWFDAEMRRTLSAFIETPDTWYRTLKGAWRLSGRELAVLRGLVAWREREARRRNVPRAWTVRDNALLIMARRERLEVTDIARLLSRRDVKRYGHTLADVHRQGLDEPELERVARPLEHHAGEVVNELRDVARDAAQRLGMAPELLARRRDLEAVCRHYRDSGALPDWFCDWREELLGDAFKTILAARL